MVSDPRHCKGQTIFVTTLGYEIEVVVRAEGHLGPSRVSRVSVEDLTTLVFVKHTDPGAFFTGEFDEIKVVVHPAPGDLILCKGHVVVVVEAASVRRNPLEPSTHALFKRLDLGEGRP